MKWKNQSKFALFGLNQEKILTELSKSVSLSNINRVEKTRTEFFCSYFERRRVQKFLTSKGVKWQLLENSGIFFQFFRAFHAYGAIFAIVLCLILGCFNAQKIVQFEILGLENLTETEVVEFVKDNFSMQKSDISVDEIEGALLENFEQVSFASCIVKGQTLVINIKEKLLPDEMYGEFSPLLASKSGKIKQISLVSGTLNVEVGDYVQEGDVLVLPYVLDSSGELKKVEACAEFRLEVYHTGIAEHCETEILLERTGRTSVESKITLFGLTIYTYSDGTDFAIFETESETSSLTNNLFLPFKISKVTKFELVEKRIESTFEAVQDEVIESARNSALQSVGESEILEEFYAIRHISTLTTVTYTIVTEEVVS